MIQSFRHKGLKRLFEDDDPRGVYAEHVEKLVDILFRLNASDSPADMNVPGFKLHSLRHDFNGFWAVTVRANWRVIFRIEEGQALDVDYLDYH